MEYVVLTSWDERHEAFVMYFVQRSSNEHALERFANVLDVLETHDDFLLHLDVIFHEDEVLSTDGFNCHRCSRTGRTNRRGTKNMTSRANTLYVNTCHSMKSSRGLL